MASQKLGSEVSINQVAEFIGRLGRFGLSIEQFNGLNGDDQLMSEWVNKLEGLKLAHGCYQRPYQILADFRRECHHHSIDFKQFSWIGPAEPPEFVSFNPDVTVALDIALADLDSTAQFALNWIERSETLVSLPRNACGKDHLSFQGQVVFRPFTLSWVQIDLRGRGPAYGYTVEDIVSSGDLYKGWQRMWLGTALLFFTAQNPQYIAKINGTSPDSTREFWIPGLRWSLNGDGIWDSRLLIYKQSHTKAELKSVQNPRVNGELIPTLYSSL